jgi:hypothetical protein
VNYRLWGALVVGLGVGVAGWFFSRRLPWRLPDAEPYAPSGIAGWMIFPVLGAVITPFKLAFVLVTWFRNLGDPASFYPLTAAVQVAMLLEFVIVNAMVVLCLLQLWSLIKQERRFPYVFVSMMLLSLTGAVLDTVALGLMGTAMSREFDSSLRTTVVAAVPSVLWITYMLSSQRVRATFVRGGGEDYRAERVPRVLGDPAA